MLLEALVACAGVTLKAVATAIGVELKSARVRAEGDLDFRGTLGVDRQAPVGFRDIRLAFDIASDAPQEKLDQLLKLTERYCVVLQTLTAPPKIEVDLDGLKRAGRSGRSVSGSFDMWRLEIEGAAPRREPSPTAPDRRTECGLLR